MSPPARRSRRSLPVGPRASVRATLVRNVVRDDQEEEDGDRRDDHRDTVRRRTCCREAGSEAVERVAPDSADESPRTASTSRTSMKPGRERLAVEERAVRAAVDDVERRLEHAEQRERRPEQERGADQAEGGRVRPDLVDPADDAGHRALGNTSAAPRRSSSTRPPGRTSPSRAEGEEDQRDEREQREVGDHRRQVRARGRRRTSRTSRASDAHRASYTFAAGRVARVDAAQALSDLTEISSQIEAAIVLSARRLHARVDARRCTERAAFARPYRSWSRRPRPTAASSSSWRPRRRGQRLPRAGRASGTIAATTRPSRPPASSSTTSRAACGGGRRGRRRRSRGLRPGRQEGRRRGERVPFRRRLFGFAPRRALARRRRVRLAAPRSRLRDRVDLYFEDGSMVSLDDGAPEASTVLPLPRRILAAARVSCGRCRASSAAIREHAYLDGRLRAALGQALDVLPRQVPLRDRARSARGARRTARRQGRRASSPTRRRLAGPELGAVALAAAASLASRLPFLIVRGEAKDYGTGNRLEGAFEPGDGSFCSKTWSHRAARPPMPSEPYGKLRSNARRLSASSTGRRAVWTPSRASGCACIPSFGSAELPQRR